jgi:glutamine amidotransferase-like uncharacterized protein
MKTILLFAFSSILGAAEPVRVALYDGPGSAGKGIPRLTELLTGSPEFTLTKVPPADVPKISTQQYDLIIFTGGSGSGQSKGIGKEGIKAVHQFVKDGGGYLGICAGAKLIDARTVSSKWRRGMGNVQMTLTEEGKAILGRYADELPVRYANGPILMPFNAPATPDFKPLAYFLTELAQHNSPVGVMTGAPAIVAGELGKGRVIAISPHPEQTTGLDEMVRNAIRWTAHRNPLP